MCTALLGIYVFTGEDCNAAFKGKGKTKAVKILQSKSEYIPVFADLGESWRLEKTTFKGLQKFVCELYGLSRYSSVNKARLFKLKNMVGSKSKITRKCKIDLYKLPPCKNSLLPHAYRVNFQTRRLKLSHQPCPDIPDPAPDHGWRVNEEGLLEPQWTTGEVLPLRVVDVLSKETTSDTDSDDDSDSEVDSDRDIDSESGPDSDWSDIEMQ